MKTMALIFFFYAPLSFAMDDDVTQELLALTGDLTVVRANLIYAQSMFVFRKNVRALERELEDAATALVEIKADLDTMALKVTKDSEWRQVKLLLSWHKKTITLREEVAIASGIMRPKPDWANTTSL